MSVGLGITVGIVRHRDGKNQAECATLLEIAEPPNDLPIFLQLVVITADSLITQLAGVIALELCTQSASSRYQCWGMRKFNTHR